MLLVLLCILGLFVYRFGCVVRCFFHFPCPTCGMSRAIVSLLRLNFSAYLYYNALALPVLFSVVVLAFPQYFNRLFFIVAILILILNLVYYFYRLSYNSIP
ncbi:MAG: DUF2752 domain-containing protein [Treponema sp.]